MTIAIAVPSLASSRPNLSTIRPTATALLICGKSILKGPASAPARATKVATGDNTGLQITSNATYYFTRARKGFSTSC
jgi:hypothetical protein